MREWAKSNLKASVTFGVSSAHTADRSEAAFDLIPFEFLESVAEMLTRRAARYGPYYWKRGRKDFSPRRLESRLRASPEI
jgi:hypothetical protein